MCRRSAPGIAVDARRVMRSSTRRDRVARRKPRVCPRAPPRATRAARRAKRGRRVALLHQRHAAATIASGPKSSHVSEPSEELSRVPPGSSGSPRGSPEGSPRRFPPKTPSFVTPRSGTASSLVGRAPRRPPRAPPPRRRRRTLSERHRRRAPTRTLVRRWRPKPSRTSRARAAHPRVTARTFACRRLRTSRRRRPARERWWRIRATRRTTVGRANAPHASAADDANAAAWVSGRAGNDTGTTATPREGCAKSRAVTAAAWDVKARRKTEGTGRPPRALRDRRRSRRRLRRLRRPPGPASGSIALWRR